MLLIFKVRVSVPILYSYNYVDSDVTFESSNFTSCVESVSLGRDIPKKDSEAVELTGNWEIPCSY